MSRTTLRAKGQLTLPEDIRAAACLEEGDLLDAEITDEGILLRPQKVIDATQAWFWTKEWQEGEREADTDLAGDRLEVFGSGEELLTALGSRAKAPGWLVCSLNRRSPLSGWPALAPTSMRSRLNSRSFFGGGRTVVADRQAGAFRSSLRVKGVKGPRGSSR